MTAIESPRTQVSETSVLVGRIVSTISSTVTVIENWYKARATRKALSRLSDRELKDIGLVRDDIDHIANSNWLRK